MNRKKLVRASDTVRTSARDLRDRETPAEELLWEYLRGRRCGGFKFRRQHPVRTFILDFYCAEARLGIELDGAAHSIGWNPRKDRDREEALMAMGIRIIRFSNEEVFGNLDYVLDTIHATLAE